MATIDIEPFDVIRLIQQYLKENNLLKTLQCLQDETSVSLNTVDSVETFVRDIHSGHWDVVLRVVKLLKLPDSKLIDLYEQIAIELIELKETRAANWLIHKTEPMIKLKSTAPDRYLHLQKLLEPPLYVKAYRDGSTKERRRIAIAEALKKEVLVVPPQRLLSLIGDALKWQRHEGLLPSGTSIDIFTSKARMVHADKETYPNLLHKHCIKALRSVGDGEDGLIKIGCAEFSPDGHYLAVAYSTGLVELRNATNGRLANDLKYQAQKSYIVTPNKEPALSLCFSDNDLLAVGDGSGDISIWKFSTGQLYQHFKSIHHKKLVSCVQFDKGGRSILSGGYDRNVWFYKIQNKMLIHSFEHDAPINAIAFSKDYEYIATASKDMVVIWNATLGDRVRNFGCPSKIHTILPMPYSKENLFIVCGANFINLMNAKCDIKARMFDVELEKEDGPEMTDEMKAKIEAGEARKSIKFYAACASPKANWIYAVDSKNIYCFNSQTKKVEKKLMALDATVYDLIGVKHHPHLNLLATYDNIGNLKLWKP